MVVTFEPSACTASMVQDFTDLPSTCTTQAPHWLVSQPTCVPVMPRCSRRNWTSNVRASTLPETDLPLTVMATEMVIKLLPSHCWFVARRPRQQGVGRTLASRSWAGQANYRLRITL